MSASPMGWLPPFPSPMRSSRCIPTKLPDHRHPPPLQLPVVASNRIGTETFERSHITFYGGSFIAGPTGEIVAQAGAHGAQQANGGVDPEPEQAEGFVTATFDLTECRENRAGCVVSHVWGLRWSCRRLGLLLTACAMLPACRWGMFRDRRPELYGAITTLDGTSVLGHTLQVKFADADAGAQMLSAVSGGGKRAAQHRLQLFVALAIPAPLNDDVNCAAPRRHHPPIVGLLAGPPTIPAPSGLSPSDSCYVKHLPSSYGVRDTD